MFGMIFVSQDHSYHQSYKTQIMKNLSLLLIVSLFLFNLQAISAQKGWQKKTSNKNLVYTPTTLKQGKTFNYIFFKPVNLQGKQEKDWLLIQAKKEHSKLGKAQTPWKLKQEKSGGWSANNTYTNNKGQKMSVGYISKKLSNGKVYMMQMISSFDIGVLLKYGKQIKPVMADAEAIFIQNKSLANLPSTQKKKSSTYASKKKNVSNKKSKLTGKEKQLLIKRSIRTAPGKGVQSSQLQVLWVDSRVDVLRGGISVDTYLLLKDGTAYTDCKIPPNELIVKKSKELQPKKWTVWRKSGTSYQIRGSWENTITFKANGRFEMSRFSMRDNAALGGGTTAPSVHTVRKSDKKGTRGTTTVSGTGIGGGTTSTKNNGAANTGTYYLKGNTITLKHDNGYVHTELFFFDETDKKSFIYKNDRFWVRKLKK